VERHQISLVFKSASLALATPPLWNGWIQVISVTVRISFHIFCFLADNWLPFDIFWYALYWL